ncbi:MAG TPA: phosphonate metabolism protein PhnM [Massilibacterium sp.]|nr:phosphonate metabolism protein PhnM [Massilibacterium sp.]
MNVIVNGKIVTPHDILEGHAVLIEHDQILDIVPQEKVKGGRQIDAKGGYITPGFVDIHSDYIETIISPRPTSLMDFQMGIRETERILMTHGITTIFHSLSIYKDDGFSHKPIRNPQNVNRLIDAINDTHMSEHLIRNRMHARFEIDNIEQVNQFIQNIEDEKVHLISFMDHSPGQGQYRDLQIYRETLRGYKDLTDEEVEELIKNGMNKNKVTFEQIKEISELALSKGIAVASHDDDSIDKLHLVQSYGTTISEFPTTLEVAKKAKSLGLCTIAGAPNVMLGGSHSGNLCATEAMKEGAIDVLCSDYYPPAMLHAIFKLHKEQDLPLVDLFRFVTLNPAKAVHMDHEIGSIEVGKKADLLIIEQMNDGYPIITATFVDGKLITRMNYR